MNRGFGGKVDEISLPWPLSGHVNVCVARCSKRDEWPYMVTSIFLINLTVLPLSTYSLFGSSETSTCKTHLGEKKTQNINSIFPGPKCLSHSIWSVSSGFCICKHLM